MRFKGRFILFFIIFFQFSYAQEKVIGVIENDADSKTISNVHVINLNSVTGTISDNCLLYTSPSPRDKRQSRMPSSA